MNFYVIDVHRFDDTKYAYGEKVNQNVGDSEKCEVCGAALGMLKWLPPLTVELSKPSYGDFVFGGFDTFLISERFKQKYESSGLSGIKEFKPVEIVKVKRKKNTSLEPPQYYYVVIVRSKTRVDEVKSKIIRKREPKCDFCRSGGLIESFEGVYLIQDTWNGEDIFFPVGLAGAKVVSQKFVDFVRDNKFTNINFTPAEQFKAPWL